MHLSHASPCAAQLVFLPHDIFICHSELHEILSRVWVRHLYIYERLCGSSSRRKNYVPISGVPPKTSTSGEVALVPFAEHRFGMLRNATGFS
jgi:hypothetical protein